MFKHKRMTWGRWALLLIVAAVVLLRGLWWYQYGFHRAAFDQVVAVVRTVPLKPGEQRDFRLDSNLAATSLGDPPDGREIRGAGRGDVCAHVDEDGNLSVVIEVMDLGHFGEWGFAYFERATPRQGRLNGFRFLHVPCALNQIDDDAHIEGHWWAVFNRLD